MAASDDARHPGVFFRARPAWAHAWRCKFCRELSTASEATPMTAMGMRSLKADEPVTALLKRRSDKLPLKINQGGTAGGTTAAWHFMPCSRLPTVIALAYLGAHNRNYSNRPLRTRMPGGVTEEQLQ